LTLLFFRRWGEVFPLSGLAGLPFVGKSGWNAFTTHVPEDGNVVVLFAPHVGIDKDGNIGEFTRNGQSCKTPTCELELNLIRLYYEMNLRAISRMAYSINKWTCSSIF